MMCGEELAAAVPQLAPTRRVSSAAAAVAATVAVVGMTGTWHWHRHETQGCQGWQCRVK